jgi:hypothetical protein
VSWKTDNKEGKYHLLREFYVRKFWIFMLSCFCPC